MKMYKFFAEWCEPCSALDETLKQVEFLPEIEHVDVDKEENISKIVQFGVQSIPALVLLSDSGNFVSLYGNSSLEKVKEFVQNAQKVG